MRIIDFQGAFALVSRVLQKPLKTYLTQITNKYLILSKFDFCNSF